MPASEDPSTPLRVLVLGGGVAGIETCLALRALAGDRVDISLIAAHRHIEYRPVHVHDPLASAGPVRVPVARLARAAGVDVRHDRAVAIDPAARRVRTAAGVELSYDAVVVAVGAVSGTVPAGAEPFDDSHVAACGAMMRDLRDGRLASLAFVEPPAPARVFDLYELALEAAVTARQSEVTAELTLVTAEPAPLAALGPRLAGWLGATLAAHGLRVVESAYVRSIADGRIELAPGSRWVGAERVIAAPRLAGPRLDSLPCDRDGFLSTDPHGRVPAVERVYAAGDCTAFPVKHPSLAAQQADAVASAIAADAGVAVTPHPFTPVLRCVLPSRLRWYVEAPLTGGCGEATRVSAHPSWSPDLRFKARFLAPALGRETRGARRSPRAAQPVP